MLNAIERGLPPPKLSSREGKPFLIESTDGVPDALLFPFPFLYFDEEASPASEFLEVIVIGNAKRLVVAETAAPESGSVPDRVRVKAT